MDWKRLTLLALMFSGCFGSPDNDDDDDDDTEYSDFSNGNNSSNCSTTLDVYAANTYTPSVVRLAFRLFCGDTNIGNKTAAEFTILEDGDPVSAFESELTMVPITASFQLTTALVLDMSGSMVESGRLPQLLDAVNTFINSTELDQEIGIYLFDGRAELDPLQPFTTDKDVLLDSVDSLYDYESVDSSTNLNGAIVRGLALLDAQQLQAEGQRKTFGGTLAVFTDGTDQAGRVSDASAVAAVEASNHVERGFLHL